MAQKNFLWNTLLFPKCKGIVYYHNKLYQESINLLKKALPEIKTIKILLVGISKFFLSGQIYSALNYKKEATNYFYKK